jgi:hypothetical protein
MFKIEHVAVRLWKSVTALLSEWVGGPRGSRTSDADVLERAGLSPEDQGPDGSRAETHARSPIGEFQDKGICSRIA